jgi:hypothetical protein
MTHQTPIGILDIHCGYYRNDRESKDRSVRDFNFDHLLQYIPELKRFNIRVGSYQFNPPIDSSDMEPSLYTQIVK